MATCAISPAFQVVTDWASLLRDWTVVAVKQKTATVADEDGHEEICGSSTRIYRKKVMHIAADYLAAFDNIPKGMNLPGFVERADWPDILATYAREQMPVGASVSQMLHDMCDDFTGIVCILTPEEMGEREAQLRAQELNGETRDFCHRHKVSIGSKDFFDRLAEEIEKAQVAQDNFNSAEQRAERYARYRSCGAGDENFWADNDYVNDQAFHAINRLAEIMDFCKQNLPLQWGMWNDKKMG